LVRVVPSRCRPKYLWDLPESVRTGGGDPLYLDRAQLHHDSCQRDVQRYEQSRQHEARLLIRLAMTHIRRDRTTSLCSPASRVNDWAELPVHVLRERDSV
jgi:hypothetical protein